MPTHPRRLLAALLLVGGCSSPVVADPAAGRPRTSDDQEHLRELVNDTRGNNRMSQLVMNKRSDCDRHAVENEGSRPQRL